MIETKPGQRREIANNSEQMYEIIHEFSMADNKIEASYGRGLKLLIPILEQFMHEEQKRGLDAADIACCFCNLVAQLLSNLAQSLARPGHSHLLLDNMRGSVNSILGDHIKGQEEMNKEEMENRADLIKELFNLFVNRKKEQSNDK